MRYDRNDKSLLFSVKSTLSDEEREAFVKESRELLYKDLKELVSAPGSPEDGSEDKAEKEETEEQAAPRRKGIGAKVATAVAVLTVLAVITTIILAIVRRDLVLFGYAMSSVVAVMGLVTAIAEEDDDISGSGLRFSGKITGTCFFLLGVSVLILIIMRKNFQETVFFSILAIIGFALIGVWTLIAGLTNIFADKFIYREKIKATCTGYIHKVDFKRGRRMLISPLFSFTRDGKEYECLYDFPVEDINGEIAPGDKVLIGTVPGHPESVWNKERGKGVWLLLFSLPFLGVAILMTVMTVTGAIG